MPAQNIEFERPFTYVFKDPNWVQRVLMGGLWQLLSVVLVGAFINLGYQKKLFLALVQDENAPLPEFDPGEDLKEGAPIFGIFACYWGASLVLSFIPCFGACLSMVLNLGLIVLMPAILIRYYTTGRFGSAFEFDKLFEFVKLNLNNIGLYVAISIIANMANFVGLLACVVGIFFTSFWTCLVTTRALAQAYRLSAPVPPGNDAAVPPVGLSPLG